ncbi:hypothetical protein WR25_01047 [Diploscapter pachys]|uniref:adenosine kinase n=1 Tax=Diploscapter pachys TaxID=2018661 RepID=A0A2A2JST1_9BILA|nr:hypothetical protein WR25_01047 [Diploscapter pachys]
MTGRCYNKEKAAIKADGLILTPMCEITGVVVEMNVTIRPPDGKPPRNMRLAIECPNYEPQRVSVNGGPWRNVTAKSMAHLPEGHLLGCGNPLLDIQAVVDKTFLGKWELKENDAILCDEKHVPMFHEMIEKYKVEYVPGGATQNALRICQWILNPKAAPNRTVFFGAVGKDQFGEQLEQKAREAGVNVRYQVNPEVKTGTCAVLITETHRSLCAHLAAANTFTIDHILKPENQQLIHSASFYYIAGFFLTVCPEAILHVAKHAHESGKPFMFNLAAPFISQFFTDRLRDVLFYVDILFGNEDEAVAFSEAMGFNTKDVEEIARKASALPHVSNKPRMVVFTQGPEPVIVVKNENDVTKFPVHRLEKDEIVDTNGAGDAFCGGFLAQYIQGKSIKECVECGCYAACEIIKKQGCTTPDTCKYH